MFVWAGDACSAISLPTATLMGNVQTTSGIGTGSFQLSNVRISRVNYINGDFAIANGPEENILLADVVISGATRTGTVTFGNASIEIRDPGDSFKYLTGTLTNISLFEISTGIFYFNLLLDKDNPASLNITNTFLKTDALHPSRFIDELKHWTGTAHTIGLKLGFIIAGDINSNSTGVIFDGLIAGGQATVVPTLTEWGMIIFMIFAGIGSVYYLPTGLHAAGMRRKK